MEIDALLFMLLSWGFTLGILTFCVIKLYRNPDSASTINTINRKDRIPD